MAAVIVGPSFAAKRSNRIKVVASPAQFAHLGIDWEKPFKFNKFINHFFKLDSLKFTCHAVVSKTAYYLQVREPTKCITLFMSFSRKVEL